MKFLKYLLYVILALVLIVIVLGIFGPKTFDASRSTVINASPAQVWPYVSSIRKTVEWGPWMESDSTIVNNFSTEDGVVGASNSWTSKKSGSGKQVITLLEPHKNVETELTFMMPWGDSKSTGYFNLADTSGQTKVTWGMKGTNDFVGRIFASMMSMDKAVGKMFDKGLANLKKTVEEAGPSYDIVSGDCMGGKYLGVRKTISMDKMEAFYMENFSKLFGELTKSKLEIVTMPTGIYYTWDMEKKITDMAAGVGFKGDMKTVPKDMVVLDIPASKCLTIDYMGGYHGIGGAHEAMDAYIKNNNLEHIAPVIEEYVTDPGAEPDSTKWVTKITYLVK